MKKIFCFVLIILFGTAVFSANSGTLRGNNVRCVDAAERISRLDGVDTVAVLKMQERILAGVRLVGENTETSNKINSILKGLFPGTRDLRIEISNEVAERIIELSYFADSDMQQNVLEGRFEFLWSN